MKMKAAVCRQHGGPMTIEEVEAGAAKGTGGPGEDEVHRMVQE